jgi:hypothetical protein
LATIGGAGSDDPPMLFFGRHGQPELCPDPVEFPELQHIVSWAVLWREPPT